MRNELGSRATPGPGPAVLSAPLAAALAACTGLPPLTPFGVEDSELPERSATLLAGVRNFEAESDFGPTDEAAAGGLELAWWRPGETVGAELALQHAQDSDSSSAGLEVDSRVSDVSFGLRYLARRIGPLRPHLGAGLAVLYGEIERSGFGFERREEDDWGLGTYVHAGFWAPLEEPFPDTVRLGLDLRWVTEEWLTAGELDLDHTQIALTIGTGF